jgi:hypothetical protein
VPIFVRTGKIGGTRIQVMSVDNGWLWFIPLGPTRTSLGFVGPAKHYKKTGKKPEELYYQAIVQSQRISKLVANGTRAAGSKPLATGRLSPIGPLARTGSSWAKRPASRRARPRRMSVQ